MSRPRLYLTLVLAALALTPAAGIAQGAAQTHTVKKGDTLWDLARQYLGDPFRWPEIYRRNTETVKDPNLIYPDQVLVISGDVMPTPGTPADVVAPRDSMGVMPPRDSAAAMPSMMPPAADTMSSMPTAAGGAMLPQPSYAPKPMTIFNPARFAAQTRVARQSLLLRSPATAVRAGDFLRAPYLVGPEGVSGAGTVGEPVLGDEVRPTTGARPVQLLEMLYVTLPAGAAGTVGEQFLTFRTGPAVGTGRVVRPTGVVALRGAPENGRAVAQLLTKFDEVFSGQGLTALDTLSMPGGVTPARVEFGTETSLLWLDGDPVLSARGQQLILAAGVSDGVVPGDQVTVVRAAGVDSKGTPLPPEEVAVVQVVRVTRWGASGRVIHLNDGDLRPGLKARVTAKMP